MITRKQDRLDIGTDEQNRLDRILTRFRSSLGGHANTTGAARGGSLRESLARAQERRAAREGMFGTCRLCGTALTADDHDDGAHDECWARAGRD